MSPVVRRALGILLALLVALTGLTACSGKAADGGYVGGDGSYTLIPVQDRAPAPTLRGKDLDGRELTVTPGEGIVVLNVWGSWCAPCRKEAPELAKAAEQLRDRARIVGINTRDADPAPAQAFARSFGWTFPSLYDPAGEQLVPLSKHTPPNAIPTTLVIDAQGRVAARIMGETTAATLVGLVNDVAGGK